MDWAAQPTISAALLAAAAGEEADRTQLTALGADGAVVATLSAREWDIRARVLANELQTCASAGDRVIVPAFAGLDFHVAFMACLYAGMVAVPVPPIPTRRASGRSSDRGADRLQSIIADCAPRAMLVNDEDAAATYLHQELPGLHCLNVETDETGSPSWEPHELALTPEATALIQYTSGSTADPKGVVISNHNLTVNRGDARDRARVTPDTTIALWLPLFHDMGLGSSVVLPLVSGAQVVQLEPTTFIRGPLLWLEAISDATDVYSSAPDFAFHMCVDRIPIEDRARLDLSGWRVCVNGSEPVRPSTLERFAEAFASCGFRLEAMRPSYGLAECTLVVTMGEPLSNIVVRPFSRRALAKGTAEPTASADDRLDLVGCGHPTKHVAVRIVDADEHRELPQGAVGEIWVDSVSNGCGYWCKPDESAVTFGATVADDPTATRHVRTGDLGFVHKGELFITGRLKDTIIIRGENFYPQDAESAAKAAHPLFAAEVCAAWQIDTAGQAAVGVALETRETDLSRLNEALRAAAVAVGRIIPGHVTATAVGRYTIPRTTSGKVRRRECGAALASGRLAPIAEWATA